jgi:hypothetical protein
MIALAASPCPTHSRRSENHLQARCRYRGEHSCRIARSSPDPLQRSGRSNPPMGWMAPMRKASRAAPNGSKLSGDCGGFCGDPQSILASLGSARAGGREPIHALQDNGLMHTGRYQAIPAKMPLPQMAFRRSTVRSRSAPPIKSTVSACPSWRLASTCRHDVVTRPASRSLGGEQRRRFREWICPHQTEHEWAVELVPI